MNFHMNYIQKVAWRTKSNNPDVLKLAGEFWLAYATIYVLHHLGHD